MNLMPHSDFERIEEEAARWTARLCGGEMSPANHQELEAWLAESEAHRASFRRYQCVALDFEENAAALAQFSAPPAGPVEVRAQRKAPWWWHAAGGAVAAVFLVSTLWLALPGLRGSKVVATAAAERQSLALADGSHAELNAHTHLSADFRDGQRRVRLDAGEALFSVAKDPARPFLVETPAGTIQVTGTVFNVRLSSTRQLEVTVLEGSVVVQSPTAEKASRTPAAAMGSTRLSPGEQLTLTVDASQVRSLTASDVDRIVAWKNGRIVFDAVPLREAAARLQEFHGHVISVAPEVAHLRLGGSYSLDQLDGFFGALEDALPVQAQANPDGSWRIAARPR